MKLFSVTLALFAASGCAWGAQPAQLRHLNAVPFTQVQITDKFWAPRCETNRKVSIPHNLKMLEESGNIKNLELAAAGARDGFQGLVFQDSDIYKVLEAASFSLATHPDPALDKQVDAIIAKMAAAQMPDGYLDTNYQINYPDYRFTNLRDDHEMYCAGHMIEGAVAHFQATGKRNFLDIAIKCANNIDSKFGPGKRMGYPGHPELELALIKLWRATSDDRYFKLSKFFIDNRGAGFFATEDHSDDRRDPDPAYWLDNAKIKDQTSIVGHAVRAAYLLSGATDVAGIDGDTDLLSAINRIWYNTTKKRMFITGGIGPSSSNEGFTIDYDLPTSTAYQETCASIAMAMWNQRLALLYGSARYADYVEKALYNGVLDGVSLKGDTFFYSNPLASNGSRHRTPWFECACCPPNVIRTLASIGGYAYATSEDAVWVNLYIGGSVDCKVGKSKVTLKVTTDYPWDGAVNIKPVIDSPAKFGIRLRVPSWCQGAAVKVNGRRIRSPKVESGYIVLEQNWRTGDSIDFNMPMPVRKIEANSQVTATQGMLAIQRGPIIYALEGCDQTVPLNCLALPIDAELKPVKRPDLLGGIVTITGMGKAIDITDWSGKLYREAVSANSVKITAIPYYAWDNREACPMALWIPTNPKPANGLESFAQASASFSQWGQVSALNDGKEVRNAASFSAGSSYGGYGAFASGAFGWWPNTGTSEWVCYKWHKPVSVGGAKVYWFADSINTNIAPTTTGTTTPAPAPNSNRSRRRMMVTQLPESWKIEYLDAETWKPVDAIGAYPLEADGWSQIMFAPVKTTSLRLVVQMKSGTTSAIQEWKVLPPDCED
ncbi:MAG: glycoside hydrolase family 127 protein [Armatimonadetes bacterium]|nr:glycoside hydrolase family 127 protein [Armatimonadota bacterium]